MLTTKRVLVVEDDPDAREGMQIALRYRNAAGYQKLIREFRVNTSLAHGELFEVITRTFRKPRLTELTFTGPPRATMPDRVGG